MRHSSSALVLDGNTLSCESLVYAIRSKAGIELTQTAWQRASSARQVVEYIASSKVAAYGINTGVGSQKDFCVPAEELSLFNRRLVRAHATRVPGPELGDSVVRGALIILLNGFAQGRSGVSCELIRLIIDKLAEDRFPPVDAGGTVGASDLVPLAQIANWLVFSPQAQAAGLPKSKETLSLINSNAVSLTVGAINLIELQQLQWVQDLAAAASMEGFRCNLDAISEKVNRVHARLGQAQVATRLRAFLQGSNLWNHGQARFLQDPLSFRCVAPVHGAVSEVLTNTRAVLDQELNSLADNPIINDDTSTALSNGNMDTTRVTLAMDQLRQGLAKTVDLSGERLHKLQWSAFSGLPTGLAQTNAAQGGVQFLNFGHIAASLITSVKIWAQPHLLISVGQLADGVEDTAGHAFHTVNDLQRQIDAAWTIVTIELSVALWSIQCRGVPHTEIGTSVRAIMNALLPLLPIGREGHEVLDLATLRQVLQEYAAGSQTNRAAPKISI